MIGIVSKHDVDSDSSLCLDRGHGGFRHWGMVSQRFQRFQYSFNGLMDIPGNLVVVDD